MKDLKEHNFDEALDSIFIEIEQYLMSKGIRLSDFYDSIDESRNHHYEFKTKKTNPTIKRIAKIAAAMNKKVKIKFE